MFLQFLQLSLFPWALGDRQSSLCCAFNALPEESPAAGLRIPALPALAAHSPAEVSSWLTSPRETCDLLFLADHRPAEAKTWNVPSLDAQTPDGNAARGVCSVLSRAYPGDAAGEYSLTSGPFQVLPFCPDTSPASLLSPP